ncbi:nuclear transport factor 2 family protein [Actinoplanes sp. Pm04-4]|uniref:Nuclear transport factor 2 family protein n=1 Tax=Paractinoplanes pyxinae TaxID=2997416 RepID=A0ABT4AVR4_9ACTN|nr:nuclear transport factor 2 family protein [Actinoplanes pyxinae]MCY1138339.1 nuclear transport factor 2 family protein [Actinoplanes pyxinae]
MADIDRLVAEHVSRFNAGVATKDFTRFAAAFAPDAVMVFDGVPVGPFRGPAEIAEAYRANPPGDFIDVTPVERAGPAEAVVRYAWRTADASGGMRLSWAGDDKIDALTLTV